jgi:hypothetical protein
MQNIAKSWLALLAIPAVRAQHTVMDRAEILAIIVLFSALLIDFCEKR